PRTLLWRISGNGLEKPSYLYGTMHVYDPRLFILGDSLLEAIRNSDGFANELDLNQLTPMISEFVKEKITNTVSIKSVMSKKAYEQYSTRLSKQFNKPADEITTLDVLKEKNKWIDESYKGKKMKTFLDAYLADLAYRQGKWIGGIEDFSDQSGLLSSIIDESDIKQLVISTGQGGKSDLEEMTSIYLNSDLDGFQHLLNGMDSSSRYLMLSKRNRKMAFRMDSLAHVRSIVFAVGAAHLPGEEGLISLLKSKGFTVLPVFSSKKIEPKDYAVPEVSKPWLEMVDPDGYYKVSMPGTPGNIRMYGILSMEIYFNIFNGTWYMATSMPLPYDQKGIDSIKKNILNQMFGKSGYSDQKLWEIDGIAGKSYIKKDASGYMKLNMLYKDSRLYYAIAFSSSDAKPSVEAVDNFFNSYHLITKHKDPIARHDMFVDSSAFYRVSLPVMPNLVGSKPTEEKSVKTIMRISTDPETGSYYLLASMQCQSGFAYQNDSAVLHTTHDNLLSKSRNVTLDTSFSQNGMRIMQVNCSMMNGTLSKTKFIFRGNRYYMLLITYGKGKWNKTADEVLNTFQLLEYPAGKWNHATSPDSLFSTWTPAVIYYYDGKDTNAAIKSIHYECFDSNKIHSYLVRIDTLDKYFWQKNDSALWNYEKTRFVTESDTVLSERIFKKAGLFQYELFEKPKGANNITRMQM
ncbi:MAG TPA: TraB/GumN family protein, partial [Puia sp.]